MSEENKDNIYTRLQKARVELQKVEMKKSGHNKFANFRYYELADFLPHINKINLQFGLFAHVKFEDFPKITITNTDNIEEYLDFSSKEVEAQAGKLAIQNLGATQTYQRRYLYLMAYEITDADVVDAIDPKTIKAQPKPEEETYSLDGEGFGILSDKISKCKTEKELNDLYYKEIPKDIALDAKISRCFSTQKKSIKEGK